jgi:DNA ligase-associated metallophosphoesterase
MSVVLDLAGETVELLPQRALYWPRRRTLFVADLHLGKAATFRSAAIPVPEATTGETVARLEQAVAATGAERLICLGDLLHARTGRSPTLLKTITTWRRRHTALEFLLIRGNHDRHAGDPPSEWHITCHDEPFGDPLLEPFVLRHLPEPDPGGYVLAGHRHPAIRVGRGPLSERLPCFHFAADVGLLPAAGAFPGTATVRAAAGDRVYVVAGSEVIQIPLAD